MFGFLMDTSEWLLSSLSSNCKINPARQSPIHVLTHLIISVNIVAKTVHLSKPRNVTFLTFLENQNPTNDYQFDFSLMFSIQHSICELSIIGNDPLPQFWFEKVMNHSEFQLSLIFPMIHDL